MRLHSSRFGLRTRLLALVLVPAVLLAAVGGAATLRQYRTADTLAEIDDEVEVLSDLTALRRALLGARAPIELEVRATSLGIDRATALELLDVDEQQFDDLDDVAAALRALPAGARPFTAARLDVLRAGSDRGADVALIDQYDQLDALARERWERGVVELRDQVVASGSSALHQRLDDLESSTRAGSAAGAMVTKLADYWFGIVGGNDRAGPARTAIAVASDQFDQAMGELTRSADPRVARPPSRSSPASPAPRSRQRSTTRWPPGPPHPCRATSTSTRWQPRSARASSCSARCWTSWRPRPRASRRRRRASPTTPSARRC